MHYIFSDDADNNGDEVLTSALLDTLSKRSEQAHSPANKVGDVSGSTSADAEGTGVFQQSHNGDEQSERYLIVDMTADGTKVAQVKSLSRDWQVLKAEVRPAPSFDGQADDRDAVSTGASDEKGVAGSMLWIEGREVNAVEHSTGGDQAQGALEEEPLQRIERLRKEFADDMQSLKSWIDQAAFRETQGHEHSTRQDGIRLKFES